MDFATQIGETKQRWEERFAAVREMMLTEIPTPQAPFLHERLVRSMHVDQALAFVGALLADPAEYQRLQRLQSTRYAQRRVDAHDTFFPHPSEARSMTSC